MKYNFFFQAEDGIRDIGVTGVQTCTLPICRDFSLRLKGRVCQAYVRSVTLYGSETCAVKEADLLQLECNDMRMIR